MSDFHRAEKLAAENSLDALAALRLVYLKRQTYAVYVGLFAFLHLFCSQWLVQKLAPEFAFNHPETCQIGFVLIGMIGLGLYFSLSKRYSEARHRAELAFELKRRAVETPKQT